MDEVHAIGVEEVRAAKDELTARKELSARDALHVAVMRLHGLTEIMTFDRGFDLVPHIERIGER